MVCRTIIERRIFIVNFFASNNRCVLLLAIFYLRIGYKCYFAQNDLLVTG
jgi:hypothetical protein